jgi:hypothetical protein
MEGMRLKSDKYRALEQHRMDIIDVLKREIRLKKEEPMRSTPRISGKPNAFDYDFWRIR